MPRTRIKLTPHVPEPIVDRPTTPPEPPEPSSNGSPTPQTNAGAAGGMVDGVPAGSPQGPARPGAHTPEFRTKAVKLLRSGAKSVAKVSRDLGIAEQTLRNWVRQADGGQARARPAARTQPNAESRHTYVVEAAVAQRQRFDVEAVDLRTAMIKAEARLEDPNRIISITRA